MAHSCLLKAWETCQIEVEIDFLIAIVLQGSQQRGCFLRPAMAIELRHAPDCLGEYGVQLPVEIEQIASLLHEQRQVFGIVKIEAAREGGEHQAQNKYVGQCVVMADFV